jgi:hypothetical protein
MEIKELTGIYKIQNLKNGKVYIGKSTNILKDRMDFINKNLYIPLLSEDVDLFSSRDFDFKIVELCSENELNNKQSYWITFFDSVETGYNLTFGGDKTSQNLNRPIYMYTVDKDFIQSFPNINSLNEFLIRSNIYSDLKSIPNFENGDVSAFGFIWSLKKF